MDYNKLRQDLIDKKYTDTQLLLVDVNKQLHIDLHKTILIFSSVYFYKLFTYQSQNQHQITIIVDDVDITYDLIMTFYASNINSGNYPYWEHKLKLIKCKDFFCIPNDISCLYDINVPVEGFELLLDVVELFNWTNDSKMIQMIKRNFPIDYNLEKISVDFIKEILNYKEHKIISASADSTVKIWDAEFDVLLKDNIYTSDKREKLCASVAYSSDNMKIAFGNYDYFIKIWNAQTISLLNTLVGHTKAVCSMAISSDNLKIVSGSYDRTIKIWNIDTGSLLNTLVGHSEIVYSVAFSHDNLKIASADYQSIRIWNAESGSLLYTLDAGVGSINTVAFSFDNMKIVSGCIDKTIKIWNVETGSLLNTLVGHTMPVCGVAFSFDNKIVVSGCIDKTIKIWNVETGSLLNTLVGHTDSVLSVAFSFDNRKIVSGGTDQTIKIWDVESGSLLNTLIGHTCAVINVAFFLNLYVDPIDEKLKEYIKNS